MAEARALWYARWPDGPATALAAFRSTEFPDGAVVEGHSLPPGMVDNADERWRACWDPRAERLLSVSFKREGPHPWFVYIDGPALALVAFETPDIPPDHVIDRERFDELDVPTSEQVGRVVWRADNSQIQDVQVGEDRRREGIARVLLRAAGAHQICSGRRQVWGGGTRTDLGDLMAQRFPYAHRVSPRTHGVAPDPEPDVLGEGSDATTEG